MSDTNYNNRSHHREILVIGNNGRWAKATTVKEARKKSLNPKHYNVYVVTPKTVVSDGSLQWPGDIEKDAPKLIGKY